MSKLFSGADIVFKCLEEEGVEFIFGYPGGAVLPIYDELKNHKFIKHILGICGDHWHPNIWTVTSVSPFIASFVYYVKCCCSPKINNNNVVRSFYKTSYRISNSVWS